ncbi:NADPH-dependent 7-cyano-7-deazaguanine reductase QueF [Pleionea sediminis]|uniref:NADPH-dependent 7-cyano-7-deazaguanine reductase QueF n=1 Tax=Pleionea sediminis TaxID=2569479 RepID=UPI0011860141|nr:NADPH-dependent 7-cyano-7-deazaguanine reductase QueF [Pleionea sediminis]
MTKKIPLGQATEYPEVYDPTLLFPVERKEKRIEIGIDQPLPFYGVDLWTAYELSWLDKKGKPEVAIAEFRFPCESSHIIESKSFKLYLNSFNQERIDRDELHRTLKEDLSEAANCDVDITLYSLDEYQHLGFGTIEGQLIDMLEVECETFDYQPDLLECSEQDDNVEETLYSHLLKSNCLITSQPDWATLIVRYQGKAINKSQLLKYIVSFRNHNEFHEQCVERIYQDIMRICRPNKLSVYARYTRRGGLDINPWRSNFESCIPFLRTARQ